MTDKERLEMIKGIQKRIKKCQKKGQNVSNLHSDYVDWLLNRIEELEMQLSINTNNMKQLQKENERYKQRIEELERENEKVKGGNFGLSKIINSKRKEIKRYKQALEFYADEEVYKENLITKAEYDADGICISNDDYAPPIIYFDSGEKARQALKGETK